MTRDHVPGRSGGEGQARRPAWHADIAKRRQARDSLGASDGHDREFFEAAPDAVFLLSGESDDMGRILYANGLAATMHGYSRGELLGMSIADLDVPEDAERVRERIEQLFRDGSIHFEARHRRRDGREFPVEVSARTTRVDGRRCVVTFNRDISERHRYELELAKHRARLDLATQANQVGFWDWDIAADRVYFSAEWKAQIGYAPHEVADEFEQWRCRVHPDDLDGALEVLQRHLDGETSGYATEFRFRHKDGHYRWIYARGEAVRDPDGTATRIFGCHLDVTAEKEAERQRAELAKRLSTLQRLEAIGTLAGGIAHDFNNILTIIGGNVELAFLKPESAALAGPLAEIRKASDRASSLVRQILMFSREGGAERRPVRVAPIVREAAELVRSATPQRIRIQIVVDDDLPDVAADSEQLHQALVNLGTNAWHAIGEGEGTVTFRVGARPLPDALQRRDRPSRSGDHVRIQVSDTGCGMSSETVERIFEPFFTTKGAGTGLGLSVVHGIVASHGGVLDVRTRVGAGSTFSIFLPPCAFGAERPVEAHTTAAPQRSRVLLVDDERAVLEVLGDAMERLGCDVTAVVDPRDGMDALRRDPSAFDAVVTDYDMPSLDGIEFARLVRAVRGDLPVVLYSGFLDDATATRAASSGVVKVLAKPVRPTELVAVVRELSA